MATRHDSARRELSWLADTGKGLTDSQVSASANFPAFSVLPLRTTGCMAGFRSVCLSLGKKTRFPPFQSYPHLAENLWMASIQPILVFIRERHAQRCAHTEENAQKAPQQAPEVGILKLIMLQWLSSANFPDSTGIFSICSHSVSDARCAVLASHLSFTIYHRFSDFQVPSLTSLTRFGRERFEWFINLKIVPVCCSASKNARCARNKKNWGVSLQIGWMSHNLLR